MKAHVFSMKALWVVAVICSAEAQAQAWEVNGNGGTNNTNYVGTIDVAPLYLRVNGQDPEPGQALLNEAGSFLTESVNNSNVAKAKGSIVAGADNILGDEANSSLVGGWENNLADSGGANLVAGQGNTILNQAGKSVAVGWNNIVRGPNQFAIGVGVDLKSPYSGGFGVDLIAIGNRSFVIGSGTHSSMKLTNTIPYSIMLGMSNTSTMLIKDQQVGIRTTAPTANFHTVGTVRLQDLPSGAGRALVVDNDGNVMIANTTIYKQSPEQEADLQSQIDQLRKEVQELKELLNQNKTAVDLSAVNSREPKLFQNVPNPAKGETTIPYYLPEGSGEASISIYSASGQLVQTVSLKEKGRGNLTVTGLQGGSYIYRMNLNGKSIDSKKMLIRD
ncbi:MULTISPECIES: T9SS type A sorting domain-containing protein [Chryseobacterium]|uniref:Secretion system C-terminal sorting domain-containing protein n=1 Tax=Chryseobacterium camelliae TaxID=1265445 RepID=A0ABU0TJS0_9FLAO|nr:MULTISPECIES: T9SS type A sorting domain-containing protein [Chryseobacterium]MDT3405722.1 hypothetical protein [Pseudacidovorax intermedius]MDQ1096468.1 hypothetical protein [Chryseobacterium camelliae]MDQ1100408.1 hypothetical protein [Chryseobacterium sp. SORGH_AS_1048]MDR6087749.1 hypothetical protein [Chryseobacterium sp. SORGH_AS_0909]MDR6132125.1 hypothetical protein [Chryseobacterium sp. SORGH_AS_1175]